MPKYRFLEHTADTKVLAKGKTRTEAFENAALALTALMVNPRLVHKRITKKIKVKAEDDQSLLYDFLTQILYLFDTQGTVFNKYTVKIKNNTLKCRAVGEKYNLSKHEPRTEVKAITYHDMSVQEKKREWVIKYVPDL